MGRGGASVRCKQGGGERRLFRLGPRLRAPRRPPSSRGRARGGGERKEAGGAVGRWRLSRVERRLPAPRRPPSSRGRVQCGGGWRAEGGAGGCGRLSHIGRRVRAPRRPPTQGRRVWCGGNGTEEGRWLGRTVALSGAPQGPRGAHVQVSQEAWPIGCLFWGLGGVARRYCLARGPVPHCRQVGAPRRPTTSPAPQRKRRGAERLSRAVRRGRACEKSPRACPTAPAQILRRVGMGPARRKGMGARRQPPRPARACAVCFRRCSRSRQAGRPTPSTNVVWWSNDFLQSTRRPVLTWLQHHFSPAPTVAVLQHRTAHAPSRVVFYPTSLVVPFGAPSARTPASPNLTRSRALFGHARPGRDSVPLWLAVPAPPATPSATSPPTPPRPCGGRPWCGLRGAVLPSQSSYGGRGVEAAGDDHHARRLS